MKSVWVVDDDEEMGRAISLFLKLMECEPTLFFGARAAAQALLAGGRPDLMILDINMPEVSGLDLLEFLRRRREFRRLPVIMLSSEAADIMIEKALRTGADGYVTKPVTFEELQHVMGETFKKHQKGFEINVQ